MALTQASDRFVVLDDRSCVMPFSVIIARASRPIVGDAAIRVSGALPFLVSAISSRLSFALEQTFPSSFVGMEFRQVCSPVSQT